MAFQIHQHSKPIPIDRLNKEVSELWDKPLDINLGARPFTPIKSKEYNGLNIYFEGKVWADKILDVIELYPCNSFVGLWENMAQYLNDLAKGDNNILISSITYNKPYFDMIDYFVSKGYEFVYIKPNIN